MPPCEDSFESNLNDSNECIEHDDAKNEILCLKFSGPFIHLFASIVWCLNSERKACHMEDAMSEYGLWYKHPTAILTTNLARHNQT